VVLLLPRVFVFRLGAIDINIFVPYLRGCIVTLGCTFYRGQGNNGKGSFQRPHAAVGRLQVDTGSTKSASDSQERKVGRRQKGRSFTLDRYSWSWPLTGRTCLLCSRNLARG
jgi:hypothetical protein